jgi:DNA-binding MarR family transcriptional regulator
MQRVDKKLIQELIDRYVNVSFKVTKKAETLIKEQIGNDLTNDQHYMLRYIHHAEKCTSSELAEAFDVNKSAITAIINRLVEKGLIDRERDETDRRVVYLTLSRSGADLFEKTEKRIHKLVESIITKFDTEEITGFIVTYEKLSEMLQKMEKEQLGE